MALLSFNRKRESGNHGRGRGLCSSSATAALSRQTASPNRRLACSWPESGITLRKGCAHDQTRQQNQWEE